MSDVGGKSLIVSGETLQSDVRGIELVIILLVSIGIAWFFAEVLSMLVARVAAKSGRARRYVEALNLRAEMIPGFKKRREKLRKVVEQRNDGASTLESRRNILSGKLKKINTTSDYFVREIGANVDGSRCYTFSVSNRYVHDCVVKGQKHPLLDESWKSGQLVEVWSKSLMDARVVIAERYSASMGYVVENIKSGQDSPSSPL